MAGQKALPSGRENRAEKIIERIEMSIINIYHGDSLKAMQSMPDKKYGLALVDPEYGININNSIGRYKGQKKSTHKKVKWDSKAPNHIYFDHLFRISKDQIIWGGNYFGLKPNKCFIIWDKLFSEDLSFSMYEYAWTSFNTTSKGFIFNPAKDRPKLHPTQKPIQLYKWLLKNYAFNKDGSKRTVFDSHGGSMSIVIACIDLGFDIDIWEIDEDYYTDAVNRIKRHLAQQDLTREPVEINYIKG